MSRSADVRQIVWTTWSRVGRRTRSLALSSVAMLIPVVALAADNPLVPPPAAGVAASADNQPSPPGPLPAPEPRTEPRAPEEPTAAAPEARVRHNFDLPGPKADAVFRLLSPQEVKVQVGRRSAGIFVMGTPAEIRTIDQLVDLITRFEKSGQTNVDAFVAAQKPGWSTQESYPLPPASAEALIGLLGLPDVAVLVERSPTGVIVQATAEDQRTVGNVVTILRGKLLENRPGDAPRPRREERPRPERGDADAVVAELAERIQARAEALQQQIQRRRTELDQRLAELEARAHELRQVAEGLKNQLAEQAEAVAGQLQKAAEELRRDAGRPVRPEAPAPEPPQPPVRPQPPAPPQPPVPPPPVPPQPVPPQPNVNVPKTGSQIARFENLPGNHAANLYKLLAEQDVRDVIVSRSGNTVEVRGSAEDLETIRRMVAILTRTTDK